MEANELMIGNTIEVYIEPQISEWVSINVSARTILEVEENPNKFRPIPLTEEWLIKLGFNKNKYGYLVVPLNGVFDEVDELRTSDFNDFVFGYYGYKNIKYVHQLQNLYYTLTGEKLTLKQ